MNHLTEIRLENFMRFRGHHTLALGPGDYAITAELQGNRDRSNWLGKTSLVEAIRYALTGAHRHKLATAWISKGEKQGGVTLVFADGTTVARTRTTKRGDLILNGKVTQEDAQAQIYELLGLDRASFESTVWVGQKQASRMVTADSGDRMKVVGSWIDLEPFERATDRCRAGFKDAAKMEAHLQAGLEHLEKDLEAAKVLLAAFSEQGGEHGLQEAIQMVGAEIEDLEAQILRFEKETVVNLQAKNTWDRVVEQGTALKKRIAEMPEVDAEAIKENKAELADTRAKIAVDELQLHRAEMHCRQGFDGACPAAQGFECPVKGKVDAHLKKTASDLEDQRVDLQIRRNDANELDTEIRAAESIVFQHNQLTQELNGLRKRALEVEQAAKKGNPKDFEAARKEAEANRAKRLALSQHRIELTVELRKIEDAHAKVASLGKQIEEKNKLRQEAAEVKERCLRASRLFGRKGAQRRVAESFLLRTEDYANEALRTAQVDLSVGVSWTHEGTDRTKTCEDCGAAFGHSAKECGVCGASRGMNIVQELLLELSDRSGAADDLAGLAFQFAAARRLREVRGHGPQFAVLDEPFGALDPEHRRSFSRSLPALLRAAGIQQSFIVAHSPDVLDALPRRIVVKANGPWSEVVVHG